MTINRYTPTTSAASGEQVAGYTRGPTVWASLEPLTGRELLNAQMVIGDTTHRIRMRYTANISRKDQIVFGYVGHIPIRTFEIESIANTDERNIELVIMAHEIN